ncbi:MAG: hypothetical protein K8W52_14530 [Deltaproteobacteria bacterium]|nr:hypothetical protein [Deltaproteobacteria bacterium]
MRALKNHSLVVAALAAALVTLAGCPKGGLPGIPGGGGGKVDPNTCGNYAVTDAGRKLKAFLSATVELNDAVLKTEAVIKESCAIMGRELGMAPGELEGQTKDVCARVTTRLRDDLKVGIKANAQLKVVYKPAVCTIDVDAAAKVAAECEAQASGDVSVTCQGQCSGTCNGECNGTCHGDNSGGKCNGHCEGTCGGSCSGGCEGSADVNASAQCKAQAEVHASVEMHCTEPEFSVEADASIVVDKAKAEGALKALRAGLPKILSVQARLVPLGSAVKAWASAASDLSKSASDLAGSFKDQAICISGQISAALGMVANIQASVSVSVSVSVDASASAGVH